MTATLSPAPRTRPLEYQAPVGLAESPPLDVATGRAVWLDACRGLIMLLLISRGFGFQRLGMLDWARPIHDQFDHPQWVGFSLYDMIQPMFMFIVGAAMPFALGRRWAAGEAWGWTFLHVLKRAVLLLLFAQLVMLAPIGRTPELINVLAQIAFTYVIAFLIMRFPWQVQVGVAVALLGGHTAFFLLAAPDSPLRTTTPTVLTPAILSSVPGGPASVWLPGQNAGEWLDLLVLGKTWRGNYATINFIPSATATIAGVLAVQLFRSRKPVSFKVLVLLATGVGLIALGLALGLTGWIPIIKRIWTASFAMLSVGISLLVLLAFYGIHRAWPKVPWKVLIVIGANCMFLYVAQMIFGGRLRDLVQQTTFYRLTEWQKHWGLFATDLVSLAILVGVAWWLYNRRIFFKL